MSGSRTALLPRPLSHVALSPPRSRHTAVGRGLRLRAQSNAPASPPPTHTFDNCPLPDNSRTSPSSFGQVRKGLPPAHYCLHARLYCGSYFLGVLTGGVTCLKDLGWRNACELPNEFYLGHLVSTGSFGSVYTGIDKQTGERVAVKAVSKLGKSGGRSRGSVAPERR
jgi:hypothetical protein